MSIKVTDNPTMEEIESEVTSLYYLQRVNYEAADELVEKATPIWSRLPRGQRLMDVATTPATRGLGRDVYVIRLNRHNDNKLDATASLSAFLQEGQWPTFKVPKEDDDELERHISTWIELIGLSEEADRLKRAINSTRGEISSVLNHAEGGHPAQDLRGWYGGISTKRRSTIGWIVAGRGNTIYVKPDPVAKVRRIAGTADPFLPPISDFAIADVAARAAVDSHPLNPRDWKPERYSLKTSHLNPMLPPDMALDRKEWVDRLMSTVLGHLPEANAIWTETVKWQSKVDPLQRRIAPLKNWEKSLPEDFIKTWIHANPSPLKWVTGAAEALDVLLESSFLDEEDLRERMREKFLAKNPDCHLTVEEARLLDNKPSGAEDSLPKTLARLVVDGASGLAPMF